MKAKEFLKEELTENEINTFFTSCSNYFEYNENPLNSVLWRGEWAPIYRDNLMVNRRSVAEGRKPVDTDEYIHDELNEIFSSKFGYPFRSGMMCCGDRGIASDYGTPYIIIPCNGVTLCYSKEIEDLYRGLHSHVYDYLEYVKFSVYRGRPEEEKAKKAIYNLCVSTVNRGKYQVGFEHIMDAANSGSEVMLYPASGSEISYYAFTSNYWLTTMTPLIQQSLYLNKY